MRSCGGAPFAGALLACAVAAGCAAGGSNTTETVGRAWDGVVRVHGSLRAMMHEGRTGTQIALADLLPDSTLYALGACSGLAGEITIVGGTAYVATPVGPDSARTDASRVSDAGACLLVASDVPAWHAVTTTATIAFEDFDAAIESLATAAGVDPETRFPFLVEGTFEELSWHVIDGSRLTGRETSHREHLQAAVRRRAGPVSAQLVGFHSRHDQTVFTHVGERTHVHCVVGSPPSAGHVDHVVVPAGATVRFPFPAATRGPDAHP